MLNPPYATAHSGRPESVSAVIGSATLAPTARAHACLRTSRRGRAQRRVHHRIGTQLAVLVIADDSDRAGQFGDPSLAKRCGSRPSTPRTREPGEVVVQAPNAQAKLPGPPAMTLKLGKPE